MERFPSYHTEKQIWLLFVTALSYAKQKRIATYYRVKRGAAASRTLTKTAPDDSVSDLVRYSDPKIEQAGMYLYSSKLFAMVDNDPGSDDQNGYRLSALNDGKGIRVQVALHAIPPPPPPGKKKRKNQAKPAAQQSAFHFHEETDFPNFLKHVIEACKHGSDTMDFKIDMKLEKEKQFTDMVENAKEKAKPTIVLVVIEIKPEDEDEDSEEEEEMATQGKKKRSELTPHEDKINEMIVTLQQNFPCKEIGCKSNFCWPDAMSGVHVPMTAIHWNMWSSAIVEGVADVNEFNAPDTRLFQWGRSNEDEVLLSC
ncbi:hypothetical protein C8J56DRAFT_888954 [Mycena floridula]|nr:hypothetical protein C8J56DRAFT_888954 [Mycena floridula]